MSNGKSLEEMIQDAVDEKSIKTKEQKGHTAQDLRTQVLIHGVNMIEKLQQSIYNKDEDISAEQARSYEMLWPVIQDLISKTDDLKKIEAENIGELIQLVKNGKITLKEAIMTSQLLQTKFEIEELPDLLAKIEDIENK